MGNEISFNNIDEGLLLSHPYYITVNARAIIGKNATLFKGLTVGFIRGGKHNGTLIVGNNVTICSNAMVCGKIKVRNNVLVAANA